MKRMFLKTKRIAEDINENSLKVYFYECPILQHVIKIIITSDPDLQKTISWTERVVCSFGRYYGAEPLHFSP